MEIVFSPVRIKHTMKRTMKRKNGFSPPRILFWQKENKGFLYSLVNHKQQVEVQQKKRQKINMFQQSNESNFCIK